MTFLPVNPMAILGWQRYLVYGALALALLAVAWIHGYSRGERKLWEYQAKEAKAAVVIVTKRGAVTERIVDHYIEVAGKTQTVTQTITQEVVKYADTNAGSCLDFAWGRLHDAAARNQLPVPEPAVDDGLRAPPVAPPGSGLGGTQSGDRATNGHG